MKLAGKVAVVTGAGRGIGRATALALAEAGADVIVNDLTGAEAVAEAVRGLGRRALAIEADVADPAAVAAMIERGAKELGSIDIAVANAAFSHRQPLRDVDLRTFSRTIDVTMWGAFHTLHSAVGQMIKQGSGGAVVLISSPHAVVAIPHSMAYNMAKAAVDHMARTAAIELVDDRIRVNVIHPGWIDTPGERKFFSEEQIREGAMKLPWKRLGTPEEIGRGVVFLCDPASDYITGTTLKIDGGISLPYWASKGSALPGED